MVRGTHVNGLSRKESDVKPALVLKISPGSVVYLPADTHGVTRTSPRRAQARKGQGAGPGVLIAAHDEH